MKAWVIAEDSAGKAVREDRVFGPVLYVRNLRGEAAKKKRVWTREAFGKTGVGHRAYLDLLKGARRVRAAGAPQLRADEREQFEVEIDVSALDAGEHAATVGRSILVQGGLDTDVLPASVWLDDGGRVRRVCFRVPETQGSGLREQWTAEFFDFGSPGAAEEPDKSQIARMRSWPISRVN
jgi:hypothetical protein